MPPAKRMTANPLRPARHRPGKPGATVAESSSEEDSSDDEQQESSSKPTSTHAPTASSFPKDTSRITSNLQNVDLNARRKEAAAKEEARLEQKRLDEEGFETESSEESEDGESDSGSEEESEEESSSEDEAAKRKLLRPVFIKKDARKSGQGGNGVAAASSEEQKWAEEEAKRKARTDALIQEQLEKNAQARAQGKVFWDDDNIVDEVDDDDEADPEGERAAWKLRELKRVKRERDSLIAAEMEREEIERRRNLTAEEREAEDREFLAKQKDDKDGKGKMGFMQKYFHKGAFYVDDAKAAGLAERDVMGGRYVDDVVDRSALPQYMQIRDMTKLGKKGRTRYKDLKSEDTGKWGDTGDRRGPRNSDSYGLDDRFRPDSDHAGRERTGANASALGDRKRPGESDSREGKRPRVD